MSNDSWWSKLSPRSLISRLDTETTEKGGHLINYREYTNKQLVTIPLVALGMALLVLVVATVMTGTPVSLGTDFTGGTELTVETTDSQSQIEETFDAETDSITPIASSNNKYVITFKSQDITDISDQANQAGYTTTSIQTVSASFGQESQRLAFIGLAAAFAGMSILIFLVFRTTVPSLAVVLSAFSDIVIPLSLMAIIGIDLTLGTVAGLLMLIGYSVDSDILLTNSVLRRSGDFYESTYRAMRTGITMTTTSIAAMTVMAVSATVLGIDLLAAIGTILVFGLLADLMNTYLLNVALLRWYKFKGVKQ